MAYQLLFVEDDAAIAHALTKALKLSGINVTHVSTVREATLQIEEHKWDAFLLDVNLPDGNGFQIAETALQYSPYAAVLMLTACTDEESVLRGLSKGAADYMRKPVGPKEIIMRLKKALGDKEYLRFGSLDLQIHNRSLTVKGQLIPLGNREFDLLSILIKRAESIVTRDEILERLKTEEDVSDRVVDSHLSRLRKKLQHAGAVDVCIETIYGSGYKIKKAA